MSIIKWQITRPGYTVILIKSNKCLKLTSSLHHRPKKHVRNVFHTVHQYLTKFYFDSAQDSKEISITMPMKMSQILRFVNLIKTQKFTYLVNKSSRCEITVGHRRCPTNLPQRPIEKRFILLNGLTMPVENVFVVKPEESHENSIYLFIF